MLEVEKNQGGLLKVFNTPESRKAFESCTNTVKLNSSNTDTAAHIIAKGKRQ